MPADRLRPALHSSLAYWASLAIAQGFNAQPLSRHVAGEAAPDLNPIDFAYMLFDTVPSGRKPSARTWIELWPAAQSQLGACLDGLESATGVPGLAQKVNRHLEGLILRSAGVRRPVTTGRSHALRIEATRPIGDVAVPEGVERLYCSVEIAGKPFKSYELRACGVVAGETIAETIASEVARHVLRTRHRAALRRAAFWRALLGLAVRKTSLDLARSIQDVARRGWLARWRAEVVDHLVRQQATVRAARPDE